MYQETWLLWLGLFGFKPVRFLSPLLGAGTPMIATPCATCSLARLLLPFPLFFIWLALFKEPHHHFIPVLGRLLLNADNHHLHLNATE
jgi:hypothetical protein